MISLSAAAPASLDGYMEGISQLVEMYPNYWGVVFCADEIIRSEIWSEMDEELREDEEYVPGAMPWDIITLVAQTAPLR